MQHLIPLLIVIFAIAKAVANAKRGAQDVTERPAPPRPTPRPAESDAERQRRFMEAIGLPTDAVPPPPIRHRTVANPPPLLPVKPPRPGGSGTLRRAAPVAPSPAGGTRTQPAVKRVPTVPPPISPAPAPLAPAAAVAPVGRAASVPQPPAVPAAAGRISYPANALLARLRDPGAIREAIILREILGPPKALRPEFSHGAVTATILEPCVG